jgi:uncharacterized protein YndB with AHSA1/START domain
MIRLLILVSIAAVNALSPVVAEDSREVFEYEIDAGIDDVWQAFTTTKGLQSWVTQLAEIDFRVGGKWRANYNPEGELGDPTTIENTILSFDPKRMLSLKATTFPEGFPFVEAAKEAWTVFYFSPLSTSQTRITVVGLGYNESEQSQKMRSFFAEANAYSLNELNKALQE